MLHLTKSSLDSLLHYNSLEIYDVPDGADEIQSISLLFRVREDKEDTILQATVAWIREYTIAKSENIDELLQIAVLESLCTT